ncbi:MAG: family 20 glycosylhydrolase [Saprospiraceae bacterium]
MQAFFPRCFIKKYIDLLATHKLNTFHWHLTEDQGWRIEIKKYPKLQTIAACRKETMIGHYSDTPRHYDGTRALRFLRRKKLKRWLTMLKSALLPSYLKLKCPDIPVLPWLPTRNWAAPETLCHRNHLGVFEDVYCAGNEKTFQFIDDVLNEVCACSQAPIFM